MWNYELVPILQDEYNMHSDYYRDCLNFDLIEVAASGMSCEVDERLDEDESFGHILFKYKITPLGVELLNDLRSKVHVKKGE